MARKAVSLRFFYKKTEFPDRSINNKRKRENYCHISSEVSPNTYVRGIITKMVQINITMLFALTFFRSNALCKSVAVASIVYGCLHQSNALYPWQGYYFTIYCKFYMNFIGSGFIFAIAYACNFNGAQTGALSSSSLGEAGLRFIARLRRFSVYYKSCACYLQGQINKHTPPSLLALRVKPPPLTLRRSLYKLPPLLVLRNIRQKNKRSEGARMYKHKIFTHSFEWVISYYSITGIKKVQYYFAE